MKQIREYFNSTRWRPQWEGYRELFGEAIVRGYEILARWSDELMIDTVIFKKDKDRNFSLIRDGKILRDRINEYPTEEFAERRHMSLSESIKIFQAINYAIHHGVLTIIKIDPIIQKYVKVVDEDEEKIVVQIAQSHEEM